MTEENSYKPDEINRFERRSSEMPFLVALFQQLKKGRVQYCILRNYEMLPYSTDGSDIDMLTTPEDFPTLDSVLLKTAKMFGGVCVVKYQTGGWYKRCFAGKFKGSWWGVEFDVFRSLRDQNKNGLEFFDSQSLWRNTVDWNGIRVASESDAMIIAYTKEVLTRSKSRKDYSKRALDAYNQDPERYNQIYLRYFGAWAYRSLIDSLESEGNSHLLRRASRRGRIALWLRAFKRHDVRPIYYWLRLGLHRLSRLRCPPGAWVVVLGADGAGKTSIIDGLQRELGPAFHNKVTKKHLRPGLLPSLSRIFGRKTKEGPVTTPHAGKPSSLIGSVLRIAYYTFDYLLGYWILVLPSLVKSTSGIMIFDRYFYDYYYDPRRSLIDLDERIVRVFEIMVPEPDMVLCLGATSHVIHSRKPELTEEEIDHQLLILRDLSSRLKNAVWIDTGESFRLSMDQAMETIVSWMSERYEG